MQLNDIEINTQYLFFKLNNVDYAIESSSIIEIVDYMPITKVPNANKAVLGVTNIRGDIIPIVDPKVIFDMNTSTIQERTSFIILNVFNSKKDENEHLALLVDLVVTVEEIDANDILDTPQFGTAIDSHYIKNMIRMEAKDVYVSVLDVNSVLDVDVLNIV